MNKSIKRRYLAYFLSVAVLIGASAYKPQCADAVALSTAAGVAAVVSAVMAGCGVSYWANSQQDAVDYIGGKIDDYLTSIGGVYSDALEWLGANAASDLFTITSRGSLGVAEVTANKILDFVTWLFTTEGVVSGGNSVSVGGLSIVSINQSPFTSSVGTITGSASGDVLTLAYDGYVGNPSIILNLPTSNGEVISWTCINRNDNVTSYAMYAEMAFTNDSTFWDQTYGGATSVGLNQTQSRTASEALYTSLNITFDRHTLWSGTVSFRFTNVPPEEIVITPSDSVVVPPELDQGQKLIVTTTAPFAAESTKDAAMQSILDTVVSQDGLSAEGESSEGITSGWTWLYDIISGIGDTLTDIKNAVLGIPSAIVSAISSALQAAFVPSQAYIATFIASLYSTFDNHFSILSYPFSLLGTFITKVGTIGSSEPIFTWGNIYEPFSGNLLIPAGSYNLNSALENQAFAYAHSIYMIVVKGLLSFQFVSFLYAWFCDVFHMKNSDYDSPFNEDGDDE